jgi:hypothetical protein
MHVHQKRAAAHDLSCVTRLATTTHAAPAELTHTLATLGEGRRASLAMVHEPNNSRSRDEPSGCNRRRLDRWKHSSTGAPLTG